MVALRPGCLRQYPGGVAQGPIGSTDSISCSSFLHHLHRLGPVVVLSGVVEDTKPDEGKLLVRPDMMKDQVVELELAEVQKLFKVG